MSGGVNVKSALRPPPSSGIPLPRSLLPASPKTDTRRRASDLSRPLTPKHTPSHTPIQTPTHSPTPCPRSSGRPSSRDLRRDAGLKAPVLQRTGGSPAPQGPRSAYGSPLTQSQLPQPHPRDTLGLGKPDHNRNPCSNKNQEWGASGIRPPLQLRRRDNCSAEPKVVDDRLGMMEEPLETLPVQSAIFRNENLRFPLSPPRPEDTVRADADPPSQSDEDMGTSEDYSPDSSPSAPSLPPTMLTMASMRKVAVDMQGDRRPEEEAPPETHSPRVNMATVAPFSYK